MKLPAALDDQRDSSLPKTIVKDRFGIEPTG